MYIHHINRGLLQYHLLYVQMSPSLELGTSSQPHHAYSSSKRNRKEPPGPPHCSSATRLSFRLVFDATDSRCAAGTADVVGRTASTSFIGTTHEPTIRTRVSVQRASRCGGRSICVESCGGSRRSNVAACSSNRYAIRDECGAVACWAGSCVAIAANTTAAA